LKSEILPLAEGIEINMGAKISFFILSFVEQIFDDNNNQLFSILGTILSEFSFKSFVLNSIELILEIEIIIKI
jgi:hypothetical protein